MKRRWAVLLSTFSILALTSIDSYSWATNTLKVIDPNGGQQLTVGKSYTVKWRKGNAGARVKLSLLKAGKPYLVIDKQTANDGRFLWKIPNKVKAGSKYRIKILSIANPKVMDISDRTFVVKKSKAKQLAANPLKVISPNGGQKWATGKSYRIKWRKGNAGATVKIHLLKSGKHYKWISKKTKNDGGHNWTIPSAVKAGSTYQIKVVSTKNTKIFDKSNSSFTIQPDASSLDLSKVTWLHTKVAKWPQTSTLKVTIKAGSICLAFKDTRSWPSISILHTSGKYKVKVNANPWVFVKKGGKWYGGTWEWMAPGKVCKNKKAVAGDHIKVSPLTRWRPRSGETLYFMVSALARSGKRNNFAARTNVVKVVWP